MNETDLSRVYAQIGYRFVDKRLLLRALTHNSAVTSFTDTYQRLEFLGDRVLGLLAAHMLFEAFPNASEGELHRRHNALVRRETCALIAEELMLGTAIILGPSEEATGGRGKKAILADVCEAVVAAIYLDGGYDAARSFVEQHWGTVLNRVTPKTDCKSALQEWAQGRGMPPPHYRLLERRGPDHAPEFVVEAELASGLRAAGIGGAKREAEQEAARNLLGTIIDEDRN